MNYCDEHGCLEGKQLIRETPDPLPVHLPNNLPQQNNRPMDPFELFLFWLILFGSFFALYILITKI